MTQHRTADKVYRLISIQYTHVDLTPAPGVHSSDTSAQTRLAYIITYLQCSAYVGIKVVQIQHPHQYLQFQTQLIDYSLCGRIILVSSTHHPGSIDIVQLDLTPLYSLPWGR